MVLQNMFSSDCLIRTSQIVFDFTLVPQACVIVWNAMASHLGDTYGAPWSLYPTVYSVVQLLRRSHESYTMSHRSSSSKSVSCQISKGFNMI